MYCLRFRPEWLVFECSSCISAHCLQTEPDMGMKWQQNDYFLVVPSVKCCNVLVTDDITYIALGMPHQLLGIHIFSTTHQQLLAQSKTWDGEGVRIWFAAARCGSEIANLPCLGKEPIRPSKGCCSLSSLTVPALSASSGLNLKENFGMLVIASNPTMEQCASDRESVHFPNLSCCFYINRGQCRILPYSWFFL